MLVSSYHDDLSDAPRPFSANTDRCRAVGTLANNLDLEFSAEEIFRDDTAEQKLTHLASGARLSSSRYAGTAEVSLTTETILCTIHFVSPLKEPALFLSLLL